MLPTVRSMTRLRTSPPRPVRRRPGTLAGLVGVLGLGLALSACGDPGAGGTAASDDAAPSATELLITSDALPRGWGDSNSQGVDYRVTVCGVDLEPEPPVRAASIRFSKGPLGPFLEQHVRVYDSEVAGRVIADLARALPDCERYEAQGSTEGGPSATFEVEPLEVAGAPEDSVAWRQTVQGRLPVTSDQLLVRRGPAAVLLVSYAIRAEPDPDVLTRALAALPGDE